VPDVPAEPKNRANLCQPLPIIINDQIENNNTIDIISCKHCLKCFKSNSSKNRHINNNRCTTIKNAKKEDDKIKVLKEELREEIIKELKGMLKNNTINNINNNTTNTNTNTINNTQNNIIVNTFGKEDISHITDEMYKQIFRRCLNSVPAYIGIKYFNEQKPENSNVYIPDIKSPYVTTYNGQNWNINDRNKILEDLYDNSCEELMCKFNFMKNKLDEITIKKHARFVDTMDEVETIHNAKEEIKKILYNNRKKSIKNKKIIEKNIK
jgi:hypothetical protein